MVKLILQVNPRAGFENAVLAKINEVFDFPITSTFAQLSDFYSVLDFTPENVEKIALIQDFEGIISVQLIPANVLIQPKGKMPEYKDFYIVLVKTERGKREQTLKNLSASDKINIIFAGYFYDNHSDLILEVVSPDSLSDITSVIRKVEGVEDTIIYTSL